MWPGLFAHFGRMYNNIPEQWVDCFDRETSQKNFEELVMATGFGLAPEKPEGSGITYDSETQGYIARFTHVVYGIGFICTREEIEDNLYYPNGKRRAESTAFSMKQTKENVHANIFNRGFTAGYTGGDGVVLFSASHPTSSGLQSNILATSADISETAIEDGVVSIQTATNDRGLKAGLQARTLHVPSTLGFEAHRILKAVLQNDTALNAPNVLKMLGSIPGGIKVNQYFTDVDAWFIRTNAPYGMISFQKRPYEFVQDNDFDTENAKAKATERYSCGWADWRGYWGSAGT